MRQKNHKRKIVGDKSSMLAVATREGECCMLVFVTKTTAVATSDYWLLNVGVKI
jgi:hypothetical protein